MSESIILLPTTAITTAVTGIIGDTFTFLKGNNDPVDRILIWSNFIYGSGGTTCKIWVQTSFDGGTTWIDIYNHASTTTSNTRARNYPRFDTGIDYTALITPTDGTLSDGNKVFGIIGEKYRVKYSTTGTYTGGTSIQVKCLVD